MRTLSQKYQARYRRQKRCRFLLKIVGGLIGTGALVYGLWFAVWGSGWLAVRGVSFYRQNSLSDQQFNSIVFRYLEEKTLFVPRKNNFLLVSGAELSGRLLTAFPSLKEAVVRKNYFKQGLEIKTIVRQPLGLWCYPMSSRCFVFDETGTAFQEAEASTGSPQNLKILVEDYQSSLPILGQKTAPANYFGLLFSLSPFLKNLNLAWSALVIPPELLTVKIKTFEGWEVILSLNYRPGEQFETLRVFLDRFPPEERLAWQYVDLRVPGRVYFK